ncbi:hypothetical protein ACT8ZV_15220 [Nocardioides sp. MAHUQ-72]|uniref:hypothetical protein n=1 Tax=unclassified Nocardioides TaxID=2615069 RepID=UPI00360906CE
MSFVAVFTASAMGFTLLVPILMVLVLMVYGAPAARRALHDEAPSPSGDPDRADVSRIAA